MSLLIGPMQMKILGHKKLTLHKEVEQIKVPKEIYIPLALGRGTIEVVVKEGDYVKIGDLLAYKDKPFYVPVFATVSGIVKGVKNIATSREHSCDHLIIENDFLEVFNEGRTLDINLASKDEIVDFIKEKGIVGLGGAGFPMYVKYQTNECENLIINAVECEPYITADDKMMTEFKADFKLGIQALLKASNASKCYIAIKKYKKDLYNILTELFSDIPSVVIAKVKDVYPMGWERTLIYELFKKRYDKLPIEVKCVVSNASSVISFAQAITKGHIIYQKMVTVSGDGIVEPKNVLVRIGTPLKDIIEHCGGFNNENIHLILGGPMMGVSCNNLDTVVNTTLNALTILKVVKFESIACLRCGQCVDYCPAGLIPCNINQAVKAQDAKRAIKLNAIDCIECGMCTYVCPSKLAVTEGVRAAKRLIKEEQA